MGFPHFNNTFCEGGDLNGYHPFRFWCYNILPLVFDDSLSQYEIICKLYDQMNKVVQDTVTLTNLVNCLSQFVEDMRTHLNNLIDDVNGDIAQMQQDIQDKLFRTGDTMSGTLNMDGNKITNVPDPINNGDASNKNYVDTKIASLGTVLEYKGSKPTINDLPPTGNKIGDVWYVESEKSAYAWVVDATHPNGYWEEFGPPINLEPYLKKDGSVVMTGNLDMGGHKITAVLTPTNLTDTANKAYVDRHGVPESGTTGQILTKIDDTDYNIEWASLPQASESIIGGIKAAQATNEDTQDVHITSAGYLKTKPSGGGTGTGLQPITVTRDEVYISTPGNNNTTKVLADPTAPTDKPIQAGQIAVYSTTNQTYNTGNVGATLLVADPNSDMEAVNKRTNDTKLAKANINDNFKRVTAVQGSNPGTESYHILAKNTTEMGEDRIPVYNTGNTLNASSILNLSLPSNNTDAANKKYVDSMVGARALLTNENIDNIITPGSYLQYQDSKATPELNYPIKKAGILEVLFSESKRYLFQRYSVCDAVGGIYIRNAYLNSTTSPLNWFGWEHLTNTTYVNNRIAKVEKSGATTIIKFHSEEGSGKTYALQITDYSVVVPVNWNAWGTLYETPAVNFGSWTIPYKKTPFLLSVMNTVQNQGFWFSSIATMGSATDIPQMYFCSASQQRTAFGVTIVSFGEI